MNTPIVSKHHPLLFNCPKCKVALEQKIDFQVWVCPDCSTQYSYTNGILNLLSAEYLSVAQHRIQSERKVFDSEVFENRPYQSFPLPEYNRLLDGLGLMCAQNEDILSLGCGSGFYERILQTRGFNVCGVDIAVNMLKHCNFPVVVADILCVPVPTASFSHILSAMVLHHLPVDRQRDALLEINRVLKSGGCAYIIEPIWMFRSYVFHPIARWLGWQTKTEKPLQKERFLELIQSIFPTVENSTIRSIDYIGFPSTIKPLHTILLKLFNIIPFTRRDEFVVIKVWK